MFEEKATTFAISLLTDQEDFRKLPKEFTTNSYRWLIEWFLNDEPTLEPVLVAKEETLIKTKVIELKMTKLFEKEQFAKEMSKRLADYEGFKNTLFIPSSRTKDSNTSLSNSKNVITDSNIQVGGSMHIGDVNKHNHGPKIHHNGDGDIVMGNKVTNISVGTSDNLKGSSGHNIQAQIQALLAKDDTEDAITLLTEYTEINRSELLNDVYLQSGRYNALKKKELRGVLSEQEINIEMNKIRTALFDLLKKI